MIRIEEVSIMGRSARGDFVGKISFGTGLHVIMADNRFGKSGSFAAIAWCLGVEQIYGVRAGESSIFPEAARSQLELNGERDVQVQKSSAHLVLARADGAKLKLSRSIVGGDPAIVHYDDGEFEGKLRVGYGSQKDPTAGFHHHFRKWMNMPVRCLLNNTGGDVPIYLENLAPLFPIEQIGGWSGIQSQQVYRYGIQEIAAGAVEYLLGLDQKLEIRLERQRLASTNSALREVARDIVQEFDALMASQGWGGELSSHGTVAQIAKRWEKFELLNFVKERFGFDWAREKERLSGELERLQLPLYGQTDGTVQVGGVDEGNNLSERVVGLKARRHEINTRMQVVRAQLQEQRSVLDVTRRRIVSAKDLVRLKKTGIGLVRVSQCPTCGQVVDVGNFHLGEHSIEDVEARIEALEQQRLLLKSTLFSHKKELRALDALKQTLAVELGEAQQALALSDKAASRKQQSVIDAVTRIVEIERKMSREASLYDRVNSLADRISNWLKDASEMGGKGVKESAGPPVVLKSFERELRRNVTRMKVGGLGDADSSDIYLGGEYDPMLGNFGLPAYGSASDRARLVLAYVLALLRAGKRHPGFVVLDEPLQQNPDDTHRKYLMDFLVEEGKRDGGQIVIYSWLQDAEVQQLEDAGIQVIRREGRFLGLE